MDLPEELTAMHPACGGKGCEDCAGTGTVPVSIPEGDLYTLKCKKCGFENGGRIVNAELPLPANGPDIGCVECGAPKEDCFYLKISGEDTMQDKPVGEPTPDDKVRTEMIDEAMLEQKKKDEALVQRPKVEPRPPKKNCRFCQGRGYEGWVMVEGKREKFPCRCTKPKDKDEKKEKVEVPKEEAKEPATA